MSEKKYPCPMCDKIYETYVGMWRHKKEKHVKIEKIKNIIPEKNNCKFCDKELSDRICRWRHENKTCKKRPDQSSNKKKKLPNPSDDPTILQSSDEVVVIKKCIHQYIYLIEKFDVNKNEFIYKFGKSERPIFARLKEHGKEAKVVLVIEVDNCSITETNILNILNNDNNINNCKEIGNEYYTSTSKKYIKQLILNNIN
jgi:hypothetical protein